MFIAPKFPSCTASYGGADRPMNLCTTECPLLRTSRGGEDLRAINILPSGARKCCEFRSTVIEKLQRQQSKHARSIQINPRLP